jgi:hypothetical protein
MKTILGYTLSSERPPFLGQNYVSTTQLSHEKTAFPSIFLSNVTPISNDPVRNAG